MSIAILVQKVQVKHWLNIESIAKKMWLTRQRLYQIMSDKNFHNSRTYPYYEKILNDILWSDISKLAIK